LISPACLVHDELVQIDLGLQHFLGRHDVDPPAELFVFQGRFGSVRYRCLHQFDGLLGEFRDRCRSLVAIGIDDSRTLRNRGAKFLDGVGRSGTVGNGCGLELGWYLEHGDTIELEVERIGILKNKVERQDA
jgi:hypothetical protein